MKKAAKIIWLPLILLMVFTSGYNSFQSTPATTTTPLPTSASSTTSITSTPTISENSTTGITPTAPASGIAFETIAIGDGTYEGESAQIFVISSNQSLPEEALGWLVFYDPQGKIVNSLGRDKILEVDYFNYFVVLVFNGWRGGIWSNFNIQVIIRENDTFTIIAHFNDRTEGYSLSAKNSQYQVVKISRTQITQPRVITFKLLDESGKERTRVTSNISE